MGDLSRNFSRSEFACKCCGRVEVDPRLVKALQELRDQAGAPITVRSGYRCPKHNEKVGGARKSQHMAGRAADIVIGDLSVAEMYRAAERIEAFAAGGIGLYPESGFVHVDVRDGAVRWARIGGKYVSAEEALKS